MHKYTEIAYASVVDLSQCIFVTESGGGHDGKGGGISSKVKDGSKEESGKIKAGFAEHIITAGAAFV